MAFEIPKSAFIPLQPLSEDELKAKVNFILNTPENGLENEALFDKDLSILKKLEEKRQNLLKDFPKPLPIINIENNL